VHDSGTEGTDRGDDETQETGDQPQCRKCLAECAVCRIGQEPSAKADRDRARTKSMVMLGRQQLLHHAQPERKAEI
jgi:hypothetical protein